MLRCRCGERARLDDVDGTKVGKRTIWYICEKCGYNYILTENTGELKEYPPE